MRDSILENPFHEVTKCIPEMTHFEYRSLVKSISEEGLREPIWLDDKAELIIDGRHRYIACKELGIEPTYRAWDGVGDMKKFVLGLNLHRQSFRNVQLPIIARNAIPMLQKYAKGSSPESTGQRVSYSRKKIEQAAEMVGAAATDVRHAILLGKRGIPELEAAVLSGEVSLIAAAFVAANHTKKKQALIIADGREGVANAVKTVLYRHPLGTQDAKLLPSLGASNTKHIVTEEQQAKMLAMRHEQQELDGVKPDWAGEISYLLGGFAVIEA